MSRTSPRPARQLSARRAAGPGEPVRQHIFAIHVFAIRRGQRAPSSGALGGFSPRWGGVRVAPGERTASRGAAEGERVRSDSIRTGRGRRVGQSLSLVPGSAWRADGRAKGATDAPAPPEREPPLSEASTTAQRHGSKRPKEKIGGEGTPFVVALHCFCDLRCRGDNQRTGPDGNVPPLPPPAVSSQWRG